MRDSLDDNGGTLGVFVGGKSSRMGGRPKGLLPSPDGAQTLVERTAGLASVLGLRPVLVGNATAYEGLLPGLTRIADAPSEIGPLGGLHGLLTHSMGRVLVVACDMPYLSHALLARLIAEQPEADVLAARGSGGIWEPLCARYDAERVAPQLGLAIAAGVRSFQALFSRLSVRELALSDSERGELRDWDAPEDLEPATARS